MPAWEHLKGKKNEILKNLHILFQFWGILWDYFAIVHSTKASKVIDKHLSMDKIPVWFEGARYTFNKYLLTCNLQMWHLISVASM